MNTTIMDGATNRYRVTLATNGRVDVEYSIGTPWEGDFSGRLDWNIDGELLGSWDGVSLTGLSTVPHTVKVAMVRAFVTHLAAGRAQRAAE